MASRSTLVASLAVLVLLSGCSGFLGGQPGSPQEVDLADGVTADGVADGEQALESHEEAVRNLDSYTAAYSYDISSGGNESVAEMEYRVNPDGERGYERFFAESDGSEGTQGYYYTANRTYYQTTVDGEVARSGVANQSFPAGELTAAEAIQPLLTNATDYETSVGERHGTTVVVYETDDIGNATGLYDVGSPDDVHEFSAQFAVDADGVVHTAEYDISYTANGEERSLAMSFEVSDIGATSVDRPDWTAED